MILNFIYLLVGAIVGFLIKHELDIKNKKKRMQNRMKYISASTLQANETLEMVRELNTSLMALHKQHREKEV